MCRRALLFLCLTAAVLQDHASGLKLLEVTVQERVVVGAGAMLVCRYDLEGEQLYAVKWYKDGDEFYRYVPRLQPEDVLVFDVPGVHVDVPRSSAETVALETVERDTAGTYRCEVTAEAPIFYTVSGSGRMSAVPATTPRPPTVRPVVAPSTDAARPSPTAGTVSPRPSSSAAAAAAEKKRETVFDFCLRLSPSLVAVLRWW